MSWLIPTLWVALVGSVLVGFAIRNTRQQVSATLEKRPNLTRDEFVNRMSPDVSAQTAQFLWDTATVYLEPKLTPHPDDDMVRDLPIDDGDWSLDWPREFAQQNGFDEGDLPDWPKGWPITLRNYGRWLEMGLNVAVPLAAS